MYYCLFVARLCDDHLVIALLAAPVEILTHNTHTQAASNHREEVRVFKKFHGSVIGKGGATLRKIREETDTKIELPKENSESDMIAITGKKENVQKARDRIKAIEREMVCTVSCIYAYLRMCS